MPLTGLGDPARVIFSRSRYTNRRCNFPLPTCFYFDDKALNSFFFFRAVLRNLLVLMIYISTQMLLW